MAILFAALAFGGCDTISPQVIEKAAQGEELRKETRVGATLPAGCPTVNKTMPPGRTTVTVSYREPTTNQNGAPLSSLAFTTIYVASANEQPKSIRVWTNDPRGGAQVTIRDVPVAGPEVGLCVTATNWAGKESAPGGTPVARASKP